MKIRNFGFLICLSLVGAGCFINESVSAQPSSLTKEEMIKYTPLWKGERFPDGRPKVPDDIIDRMKYVSITEVWEEFRGPGGELSRVMSSANRPYDRPYKTQYYSQYYGGFKQIDDKVTVCGRAYTIQFMPYRPDVNDAIQKQGDKDGRGRQFSWGVDQLQKGDVYVANVCEGLHDISSVGDNVANTMFARSGNGGIIRGTVRDLEGILELEGFNLFVRDFRPQSISSAMVIGMNNPIQIGYVTVMPGDVVLGKREGVVFIPPHLALRIVEASERVRLNDKFAHIGVQQGRFTANEADGHFSDAMNKEFNQWLLDNADTMGKFFKDPKAAPTPEFIRKYAKDRESGAVH